jgi:hypothetical protein
MMLRASKCHKSHSLVLPFATSQVKFINSGTVKSVDTFIWGTTTTGRDPDTTAANSKAGKVLYLEKVSCAA